MKKLLLFVKKRIGPIMLFLFWATFVLIFTYRLIKFPIFEDEAIHLLMSERLFNDPLNNFFTFMRHGFLPTLGWLIFLVRFFVEDSLFAGRLLNVLLASSLFYWLYLVKKEYKLPMRFFILSSTLFLFSPILFLNSRVTLLDTPVMVFSAWCLYLLVLSLRKQKPVFHILFFLILLFCLLIKFTSLFIIPSLIYILYVKYKKTGKLAKCKYPLLMLFSAFMVFFLIIFPFFYSVSGVLGTGLVFNLKIGDILSKVHQNFWLFLNWSKVYYPFFPLSVFFFVILLLGKRKTKGNELMTALLIWFVTSFFTMVFFNRFFYPRHILMLLVPLQVISIFVLQKYSLKVSCAFVIFLVLMRITLFRDLLLNFTKAEMAKEDRFQYLEDYTSGINIDDIANFLSDKSVENPNKRITVWLDGSWVMEYGLRRALKNNSRIELKSFADFESQRFAIPRKVFKDNNELNYAVVNKYRPLNINSLEPEKIFSWGGYHPEYLYAVIQ